MIPHLNSRTTNKPVQTKYPIISSWWIENYNRTEPEPATIIHCCAEELWREVYCGTVSYLEYSTFHRKHTLLHSFQSAWCPYNTQRMRNRVTLYALVSRPWDRFHGALPKSWNPESIIPDPKIQFSIPYFRSNLGNRYQFQCHSVPQSVLRENHTPFQIKQANCIPYFRPAKSVWNHTPKGAHTRMVSWEEYPALGKLWN